MDAINSDTVATTMPSLDKKCRFCEHPLTITFVDLGMYPLSNSYLHADQLNRMCPYYPLHAYVCDRCYLVQIEEFEKPENIFTQYSYASSYSKTWLEAMEAYTQEITERLKLGANSQVIEIASNDGYLLKWFMKRGIPVLGIEPAQNVAETAIAQGIPTLVEFFGSASAKRISAKHQADLLIGNNVLAHTPYLNDFVAGMKTILKPDGVITMEFPHLLQLIQKNQFDTIYQEHYSYFSFTTVEAVFKKHGLVLFDVQERPSHGGSLRIFGRHAESTAHPVLPSVAALKKVEHEFGMGNLKVYREFSEQVNATKRNLLKFLIEAKENGKKIVGYGAPAKGNTLLTFCGIRTDFLDYVVDRSPLKQGKYLPGTLIPIEPPSKIEETRPDYVIILPWNLKTEIMTQMAHIRDWGGKFIVPIPEVQIL